MIKQLYSEKNKLPLTFKYIENFRVKTDKDRDKYKVHYLKCEKYQTDFLIQTKPYKNLVRML